MLFGGLLGGSWLILRICAGGSFGVVYKGIDKATGEVVAIKHVRAHFPFCRFVTLVFVSARISHSWRN